MANNFKSLKAKKFLPMLSERQAKFEGATATMPQISDQATVSAKALHPKAQHLKIAEIIERNKEEIMQDTLADEVLEGKCQFEKEWNINGEKVVLSVEVIK